MFQFCTDGMESEVQGVQLMNDAHDCNIRYYFRDKQHTGQCTLHAPCRILKHQDMELLDALITGEHSFCKEVCYSAKFRQMWIEIQGEADWDLMYACCKNLGYAEQRHTSRSTPMSELAKRWTIALSLLIRISRDPTNPRCQWASRIVRMCSGEVGFQRMCSFFVIADFFVAGRLMLQAHHDRTDTDISTCENEICDMVDVITAMFGEGRIFSPEANGSYTYEYLSGMKASGLSHVYFGSRRELADFGWPTNPTALDRPVLFARQLCDVAVEFFKLNWPEHAWRNKFRAFQCGPKRLPEQMRLDLIEAIAVKEGVCPVQARQQFFELLPFTERLWAETQDSRKVWILIAEKMRLSPGSNRFKPDKRSILSIIFTYVGILDSSCDIERLFSKLQLLESKRRAGRMGLFGLKDSLRVAASLP